MARYYSNPNPHSQTIARKYWRYVVILIAIILGTAFLYYQVQSNSIIWALLGFLLVSIFITFAERIFKGDSRNDQGSVGEWEIKKILQTLSDDFAVFQNVPVRRNLDIDFVLVGPTGIYAIEAKSHRYFSRWGSGRRFIPQTISESLSLKQILKRGGIDAFINAVLVFSRASVRYGFTPQNGVYVISKPFLLPLLARGLKLDYNRTLTEHLIQALYTTKFD